MPGEDCCLDGGRSVWGVRGVPDPFESPERDPLEGLPRTNPERGLPCEYRHRASRVPPEELWLAPRRQSPPLRAEAKVLESRIPRRFAIFAWVSALTVGGMAVLKANTLATGAKIGESEDIPTGVRRVFSMSLTVVDGRLRSNFSPGSTGVE